LLKVILENKTEMRRRKLTELIFDNYCLETEEMKERCQETVFEYYYDRNNMQLEEALDEIASDITRLESTEQYERCLLLKDILERFE